MPNHVRTVIKFKNLKKKDDFDFILRMIARPLASGDDMFTPDHEDWVIDFNKIIPEPQTIEECPRDCIRTEMSHVEADEDRPWFDWYRWRINHWDTKWGAYDGYTKRGKSYLAFVFSTAWSISLPIINRLTVLGYDFEVLYADEDLGCNCGKITYKTGDSEITHLCEHEAFKDTRGFAERLWDKY